ncbi:uncharacterized protein BP5553_07552 [Venustampulla echinocandica]|uniref:Uncharacterized protein n=1 Tax=Venustampulla echinocandica TaxID=2656787 RepID=A0A370TGV4_9HELO|nr:uncharacterized protein BP5553_07552 [Venustampulla echinocandica]RDL34424.1 hypothetical protein BP5553_07552 [Venustampulla echinocandica]
MQFTTAALAFAGFMAVALAAVVQEAADLPHPLVPFQYKGTLGGHDVQLNGTVEEIYAQMKVLHPEFDAEHAIQNGTNASAITPQNVNSKSNYICKPVPGHKDWDYANGDRIAEGIRYLKGIDICDVGPQTCVRISCSWSAGIFLCNDNDHAIFPKCNYIASYAQDLIGKCSVFPVFNGFYTCGQKFDTDRYNVIVRSTSC